MMKGLIHQKDVTILNLHTPNNRAPKHMRQKLMKLQKEKDESVSGEDFNTSLAQVGKSSRQKFNKDIVELNSTMNQQDIIEIYQLLHQTRKNFFFP